MANRIVVEVPSQAKVKGASGRPAAQAVESLVNQALKGETFRRAQSKLPGLQGAHVEVQEGTDPKGLKLNVPRDSALKGLKKEEIERLVRKLAQEAGGPQAVEGVRRIVIDSPRGRRDSGNEREAVADAEAGCYCRWRRACEI